MVNDNSLSSRIIDVIVIVVLVILALSTILPLWYTLCLSLSDKSAAAAGLVGLLASESETSINHHSSKES